MKKINLKNKITLTLTLSPIIVLGIVYFIVMPTIRDIISMKNNIEAQRLDLENKYRKGQSLKKLNEDLKVIEPQLEILDDMFIKRDEVLEFITTIENIATKNNIDQKINLDLNLGVKENEYKKTPVQLSTSGYFSDQLKYLLAIEALNFYINPSSLNMTLASTYSPQTGSDARGSVNMLIFADSYWK